MNFFGHVHVKQLLLACLVAVIVHTPLVVFIFSSPPQIQWFWRALRTFDQADRARMADLDKAGWNGHPQG